MKYYLLVFAICFGVSVFGQVEKGFFRVTSDDDEVGHLTANKKIDGEVTTYEISSEVTVRVVFKLRMTNEIQAVFKEGVLIYSSATLYLNDKVYSDTRIEKKQGFYTVIKDGHETKIFQSAIRSSSAKLYWQQPISESVSLSETEGEMKDLDIQGFQKYALTADGSERSVSTYIYSETQGLSRINVVRPWVPELEIFRVNKRSDLGIE
ncbi:MAG: DUF6134 family protein [Bacteroidota bacterium]